MFRRRKRPPEAQPQAPRRGWRPQLDDHQAAHLGIRPQDLREGETLRPVAAPDPADRTQLWGIGDDDDNPTSHLVWVNGEVGDAHQVTLALKAALGGLPDDDHPRAVRYTELQEEACDLARDLRRKLGEVAVQQHTELTALRAERDAPPLPDKARPLPMFQAPCSPASRERHGEDCGVGQAPPNPREMPGIGPQTPVLGPQAEIGGPVLRFQAPIRGSATYATPSIEAAGRRRTNLTSPPGAGARPCWSPGANGTDRRCLQTPWGPPAPPSQRPGGRRRSRPTLRNSSSRGA